MDQSGYGLIETMRVREGRIPLLPRHLARLQRSLNELGLPTPAQNLVALVTPFSATGDAVLRLEVRDGRASVTVRAAPPLEAPAVITAAAPHRPYPHKATEPLPTQRRPTVGRHMARWRGITRQVRTWVRATRTRRAPRCGPRAGARRAAGRLWPGKCVTLGPGAAPPGFAVVRGRIDRQA